MDSCVCSVCGQTIEMEHFKWVSVTEKFSETFIKILCPRDGLPKHLVDYYDIRHLVKSLKSALLSPRTQVKKLEKYYQCLFVNNDMNHLREHQPLIYLQNLQYGMDLK